MNYTHRETQVFVTMVLKRLDYEIRDINKRIELVAKIEEEYGEEIQNRFSYYVNSNQERLNNRNCLKALQALLDILAEYIILKQIGDRSQEYPVFRENELPNTLSSDQTVQLSHVSRNLLKEEHKSHIRPRIKYTKNTIAKHSFLMEQIHINGLDEVEAEKRLQEYRQEELYYYTDYLRTCPYIQDYLTFDSAAREMIETEKRNGEKLSAQELKMIKNAIGYRKYNSIEIDKDIIAIARSHFGFISFTRISKSSTSPDYELVDLLNKNHIKACLKFPKGNTDKFNTDYGCILYEVNLLIQKAMLTDFENDVLELYRYHDMTQADIAKEMNVSQQFVSKTIDRIAIKCFRIAEREYEDWYYLNVEKGVYKRCSKCGEIKLLSPRYYKRNGSSNNGFRSICKNCEK